MPAKLPADVYLPADNLPYIIFIKPLLIKQGTFSSESICFIFTYVQYNEIYYE